MMALTRKIWSSTSTSNVEEQGALKGTVDRNAQSERRSASRPVQPRPHSRHLEWNGERRGRGPGVRLVEIEELRPRPPRRIPMPRATNRPHRPRRHCLAPPRTRERRAGVQRSLQCKPQSVMTNCATTPRRSKPAGRRRMRSPSTQNPRRCKPTGVLTCHERSQACHQPHGHAHATWL